MRAKSKRLASSPAKSRASKKARADTIYDDPERLLESEKSPLFQEEIDLQKVLNHPISVATLTEAGITSLLGVQSEQLRTDIALFKEDGVNGRYDRYWVEQAQVAAERRQKGDFVAYEKERFANDWGEESELLSDSDEEKSANIAQIEIPLGHSFSNQGSRSEDGHVQTFAESLKPTSQQALSHGLAIGDDHSEHLPTSHQPAGPREDFAKDLIPTSLQVTDQRNALEESYNKDDPQIQQGIDEKASTPPTV